MGQTTIKDVARRAGVSFQTVSLVLNHPEKVARTTRETIETAMRDLDFVPSLAARSLRKKPSRSIACVFSLGAQAADAASGPLEETLQGSSCRPSRMSPTSTATPWSTGAAAATIRMA
ncbi:LacI family DNA-binding transcriptional regulator [Methylobacterium phyllosphaerae]